MSALFRTCLPIGVVISLPLLWAAAAAAADRAGEPSRGAPAVAGCVAAASIASLPPDRPIDYMPSFGHDVREARKPRQRSVRHTTPSIETDSTEPALLVVDLDQSRGQFLFGSTVPMPLAGHPAELLRPPSRLA